MSIRIPTKANIPHSSLRVAVSYRCPACKKENRFYHDLIAESGILGDWQGRNRKNLKRQLEQLADNKNPVVYPKLRLRHACKYCETVPAWADFDLSKIRERMFACILVAVVGCIALVGLFVTPDAPRYYIPLTFLPFLIPLCYGVKTLLTIKKKTKRLRSLGEEDFPIFSLGDKPHIPQPQPTTAPPKPSVDEYLDDITFIRDMRHTPAGFWHQYDILFASQIYGWGFMVKWADYMSASDIANISEVIIGDLYGPKNNLTEQFRKNNSKLSGLSEVEHECGMLSIAGISKALTAPLKIVWINQTSTLRLFTLESDEQLIKKYVETAARWSFGTENAMKLGKPIPEGQ